MKLSKIEKKSITSKILNFFSFFSIKLTNFETEGIMRSSKIIDQMARKNVSDFSSKMKFIFQNFLRNKKYLFINKYFFFTQDILENKIHF